MRVVGLWRHPVKSMQGERVDSLPVDERGVEGDRRYGVLDRGTGRILSAKREPRLLDARALQTGPELVVCLPNGETVLGLGAGSDTALSAWLDRPVHLQEAGEHAAGTFEMYTDPADDESDVVSWTGPEGSFVDLAAMHVLTTASLRAMQAAAPDRQWDVRRFRPNVLLDTEGDAFVEDEWVGSKLRLGDVVLEVFMPTPRCSMIGRAQPGGLDRDTGVVRSLAAEHNMSLGVYARVETGGVLRSGDQVEVS